MKNSHKTDVVKFVNFMAFISTDISTTLAWRKIFVTEIIYTWDVVENARGRCLVKKKSVEESSNNLFVFVSLKYGEGKGKSRTLSGITVKGFIIQVLNFKYCLKTISQGVSLRYWLILP